jgi:hypothetical protein
LPPELRAANCLESGHESVPRTAAHLAGCRRGQTASILSYPSATGVIEARALAGAVKVYVSATKAAANGEYIDPDERREARALPRSAIETIAQLHATAISTLSIADVALGEIATLSNAVHGKAGRTPRPS